jgi:hypothetical protein
MVRGDYQIDLYSIPARICLSISIAGGAFLFAVVVTSLYFME